MRGPPTSPQSCSAAASDVYKRQAHTRAGQLHVQNYPLNSGKGSAYEGGIREPMIVRWPGIVAPQTQCDHYLMIEDFFPTILEMAGVDNYTTVQQRDGISFMPLLTGKGKMKDRDIYWHYPNSWGPSGPGIGATCSIRSGEWKLVYYCLLYTSDAADDLLCFDLGVSRLI